MIAQRKKKKTNTVIKNVDNINYDNIIENDLPNNNNEEEIKTEYINHDKINTNYLSEKSTLSHMSDYLAILGAVSCTLSLIMKFINQRI